MAQFIQFFVDDTSPAVSYSPFRDTLSTPNLTAGWNPYFNVSGFTTALGQVGTGKSYHATSLNNASLSLQWNGTGVQLYGYTNHSDYEILLDGIPQSSVNADSNNSILAAFRNLTNAVHTVSLVTKIPANNSPPTAILFFDGAQVVSVANVSSDTLWVPQSINQRSISYTGEWSYTNASGNGIYISNTKGDIVRTQFNGASFLLMGATSSVSGKYSVVLDDVATTLSAQSSFTQQNTLLYFVTGLDLGTSHDVQVINEDGGELSLNSDGFQVYSVEPPSPSTTSSSAPSMNSSSISSGTIAALILAGFLGFIVLSGGLCFFVVIRPRRRRKHFEAARARRARTKDPARDAIDQILDICPPVGEGTPTPSKKSGFNKWRDEVEGGYNTQNIGIVFRKNDSNGDNRRSSGKLSLATSMSKPSKDKKTTPISEGSWSPSFMLELPLRSTPSYEESNDDQDFSGDGVLENAPFAMTPLSSLSYITPPPPISRHPPSYADSNSSVAIPRSVPRSVSNFTPSPIQDRVVNEFLLDEGPNIRASEVQSVGDSGQVITSLPEEHFPPSPTYQEDQDSAHHTPEDATSGIDLAQMARLGLHTQTLEFPEHLRQHRVRVLRERELPRDSLASTALTGENGLHIHPITVLSETASSDPQSSFLEVPSPVRLHHSDLGEQSIQEGDDGFFLDVHPASPFRVDFSGMGPRESVGTGQARPPDIQRASTGIPRQSVGRRRRSVFRITPPSLPPSPAVATFSSTDSVHLTTSSDISDYMHSPNPTDSSGHGLYLTRPSQQPVERLNSPTTADRAPEEIPSPSIPPRAVSSSPIALPVPNIPPPTAAATTFPHELVSYIDFTTSCDVSQRTHSIAPTESSGFPRSRVVSSQQPSRLSNPIVPDQAPDESLPPPPPPLSTLPAPPPALVTFHPSPAPHRPASTSPPRLTPRALPRLVVPNPTRSTRPNNSPPDSDTTSALPHVHPYLFLSPSPSESPAVSYSEIRFRRGDSMSEEARPDPLHVGSVPLPHPLSLAPGPPGPNPAQGGSPAAMPSPGQASYIVQHVLGKTAGSSSSISTNRQGRS